jgi:hypothetical protein
MIKPIRVIHPILIAAFPILLLYSRNMHAVEFSEILLPLGWTLLASGLVWGSLRALRLDGPTSGLIVSTGLLLFFSFGHAVKYTVRLEIGINRQALEGVVLGIEALALALVIVLVLKKPRFVRSLTGFINATASALVVLSLAGIVGQSLTAPGVKPPTAALRPVPRLSPPEGRLPDVYFLVLDAYGRSDTLRNVIGFDNSAFLARLESQGFFIAGRSTANYCQTALSLSSTLNLGYLDDLAGSRSDDRLPLKHLIAESAVVRGFRSQGYRVVTFDSGFDATESIEGDLTLGPAGNLRTFPTMIVNQTPLWLLLGARADRRPHQMHRERILRTFDELPAATHPSEAPTFTFAHFLCPHPPFIFGADGRDVSAREGSYSLNDSEAWREVQGHGSSEDYASRYRDQAAYLDSRVEEVVARILSTSKVEPIIIIQGDHGPGSHFQGGADQPNDLRERMTVFNAVYLPKSHRAPIDPSISLVNTFRLVFDRCFGAKLGLVDDRNFYSSYPFPYVFTEVTGKIEGRGD